MKPIPGLQDIQGLDPIGIWPLAVGWWVLIGLAIISLAIVWVAMHRRRVRLRSWQYQVLRELEALEKNLTPETSQTTAAELSKVLRRLAIRRFSRAECAGLEGQRWLTWLSEKDPSEFDWSKTSRSLIEAPFSPSLSESDLPSISRSIQAAKGWI